MGNGSSHATSTIRPSDKGTRGDTRPPDTVGLARLGVSLSAQHAPKRWIMYSRLLPPYDCHTWR
jgi:hypothetical protein